jgi:hypothetical protein
LYLLRQRHFRNKVHFKNASHAALALKELPVAENEERTVTLAAPEPKVSPSAKLSLGAAIKTHRVLLARLLALAVDAVQLGLFPIFSEGFFSPANDALDLATGVALSALLGWHWGFLPVLGIEALPVVDEFPTWSALVFFLTRKPTVDAE